MGFKIDDPSQQVGKPFGFFKNNRFITPYVYDNFAENV